MTCTAWQIMKEITNILFRWSLQQMKNKKFRCIKKYSYDKATNNKLHDTICSFNSGQILHRWKNYLFLCKQIFYDLVQKSRPLDPIPIQFMKLQCIFQWFLQVSQSKCCMYFFFRLCIQHILLIILITIKKWAHEYKLWISLWNVLHSPVTKHSIY